MSCSTDPHRTGDCTSHAGAPESTRGSGLCRSHLKSTDAVLAGVPGGGGMALRLRRAALQGRGSPVRGAVSTKPSLERPSGRSVLPSVRHLHT